MEQSQFLLIEQTEVNLCYRTDHKYVSRLTEDDFTDLIYRTTKNFKLNDRQDYFRRRFLYNYH